MKTITYIYLIILYLNLSQITWASNIHKVFPWLKFPKSFELGMSYEEFKKYKKTAIELYRPEDFHSGVKSEDVKSRTYGEFSDNNKEVILYRFIRNKFASVNWEKSSNVTISRVKDIHKTLKIEFGKPNVLLTAGYDKDGNINKIIEEIYKPNLEERIDFRATNRKINLSLSNISMFKKEGLISNIKNSTYQEIVKEKKAKGEAHKIGKAKIRDFIAEIHKEEKPKHPHHKRGQKVDKKDD